MKIKPPKNWKTTVAGVLFAVVTIGSQFVDPAKVDPRVGTIVAALFALAGFGAAKDGDAPK